MIQSSWHGRLYVCVCAMVHAWLVEYCGVRSRDGQPFFFLMTRRPPRSTLNRSSAASDVYKRQRCNHPHLASTPLCTMKPAYTQVKEFVQQHISSGPVSYTHLRAHETVLDIVCRLLLEKKKRRPPEKGLGAHNLGDGENSQQNDDTYHV